MKSPPTKTNFNKITKRESTNKYDNSDTANNNIISLEQHQIKQSENIRFRSH
jgi:hypothetical protein